MITFTCQNQNNTHVSAEASSIEEAISNYLKKESGDDSYSKVYRSNFYITAEDLNNKYTFNMSYENDVWCTGSYVMAPVVESKLTGKIMIPTTREMNEIFMPMFNHSVSTRGQILKELSWDQHMALREQKRMLHAFNV